MYQPHQAHRAGLSPPPADGGGLLEELDRIAPIKSFDAFPKVQSTYTAQSRRGGVLTTIVSLAIFLLVLNDLGEFLYGAPDYSFQIDNSMEHDLQLNVDLTVAMPCHYLSIDLRDAVGDRLHLSNAFAKEGTVFEAGRATHMKLAHASKAPTASKIISDSRRSTPNQKKALAGVRALFSSSATQQKHYAYRPTYNYVADGPACRIYGSVQVKKVTGNLHITTLGHGYMSGEHTDHSLMNLTHVIHEFSFGPFFPAIAQPLDLSLEKADDAFTAFQYFLRIVPTTYIDSNRRTLITSQYAVTEATRSFDHGRGVPGIFFKYDLEPMSITIRERTTSLYQFLIRLVGVIGGVWTVAAFGLRVANRAEKEVTKAVGKEKDVIPSSLSSTRRGSNLSFMSSPSPGMARANSWLSGQEGGSGDWKRR